MNCLVVDRELRKRDILFLGDYFFMDGNREDGDVCRLLIINLVFRK